MPDVAHKAYSQKNSPSKSSTDNSHVNDSPGQEKSSLQRPRIETQGDIFREEVWAHLLNGS